MLRCAKTSCHTLLTAPRDGCSLRLENTVCESPGCGVVGRGCKRRRTSSGQVPEGMHKTRVILLIEFFLYAGCGIGAVILSKEGM